MKTSNLCYFNGDLIPYPELQIHVSDLQMQRGYGVFDFFRARNGQIPWLEDYTDRLFNSMKLAEIDPIRGTLRDTSTLMTKDAFTSIIHGLHRENREENGAFKVIVTGGFSDTLATVTGTPNFMILNVPWTRPPAESYEMGVQLVSHEYVRPDPLIKTLNYFNTVRLRKKFREFNAVDVLYHDDHIREASRANLFLVKDNTIYTPASGILEGITRKQVLSILPDVRVEDIEMKAFHDFDEMFMASTSRDITPIVGVEGVKIGDGRPGKISRQVMEAFRERGW